MRGSESVKFSNIAATTNPFTLLLGGKYGFTAVATGAGTIKLQKLALDGATYVSIGAASDFATVAGYTVVELPPGQYRLTIATFTAIYADITRIPGE